MTMPNKERKQIRRNLAVRVAATTATLLGTTGVVVAGSSWATASAAETHQNCVTVDGNGDITGFTPRCSQTITTKGGDAESQAGENPCTNDAGVFTTVPRTAVIHVNVNGDGDIWVTGTDDGTASFVPTDPSAPSGSGTWTGWFGFNLNDRNTNQTSTFDVAMHMSNGQTVIQHEVMHFGLSATGLVTTFDNAGGSCS